MSRNSMSEKVYEKMDTGSWTVHVSQTLSFRIAPEAALLAGNSSLCELHPCAQNAECIPTQLVRYCACECGYIGNGYDSCTFVPPNLVTVVQAAWKLPIPIPHNITLYEESFLRARRVIETYMDNVLNQLNGYYKHGLRVSGLMYAYLCTYISFQT